MTSPEKWSQNTKIWVFPSAVFLLSFLWSILINSHGLVWTGQGFRVKRFCLGIILERWHTSQFLETFLTSVKIVGYQ